MPEREATFVVNAPPDQVWAFIRDFESLCTCIPGVERIRVIDERSAELTVREKIGVVPLIMTLTAVIDSEEPPRMVKSSAEMQMSRPATLPTPTTEFAGVKPTRDLWSS